MKEASKVRRRMEAYAWQPTAPLFSSQMARTPIDDLSLPDTSKNSAHGGNSLSKKIVLPTAHLYLRRGHTIAGLTQQSLCLTSTHPTVAILLALHPPQPGPSRKL